VRYKGKGFIDTFVYRLSDVFTQWSIKGLSLLGVGTGGIYAWGALMAGITAAVGYVVGRQHEERSKR